MCHLHYSYWPINIKLDLRLYSDIQCQRLQNFVWMFVQQVFMLTSKPPITTQWQQCGQSLKLKHAVCIYDTLVTEDTLFGTQQSVWKERFWGKSVLEGHFRTVILPPVEVSDYFAFDFISNLTNDKLVEQFWDYLPENYIVADYTFLPPVWSECSASSFRTTNTCESFHAHFNALFWSAHLNILFLHLHCKKYRMRPTWKWEASIKEGIKYQKQ